MDPNSCLHEILEAIEAGDRDSAAAHCEDLAEWINKGGFLPEVKQTSYRCFWVPEAFYLETKGA